MREEDLEAVALLRFRCFQRSRYRDARSVAERLGKVFLDNPWRSLGVESLVYEDERGRIVGFRGLQARPMRFRGEPVVAAVSSQFMVDPEARTAGIAIALMRAALEGRQDLLFTDLANPTARRLWELVKGAEIGELSFQWIRPLRPMRWMAGRLGSLRTLTWARRFASPVLRLLDTMAIAGPPFRSMDGGGAWRAEDLSAADHAQWLGRLNDGYELVPVYDQHSLQWTVELLRQSLNAGDRTVAKRVVDQAGKPLGFFLGVVRPGAALTVVQMAATRSGQDATLASLLVTAARAGCVEVTGRAQPEQLAWVAAPPAMLALAGPRFIAVAREPALVDAIRSGRAWITRLEGEYCMGF